MKKSNPFKYVLSFLLYSDGRTGALEFYPLFPAPPWTTIWSPWTQSQNSFAQPLLLQWGANHAALQPLTIYNIYNIISSECASRNRKTKNERHKTLFILPTHLCEPSLWPTEWRQLLCPCFETSFNQDWSTLPICGKYTEAFSLKNLLSMLQFTDSKRRRKS